MAKRSPSKSREAQRETLELIRQAWESSRPSSPERARDALAHLADSLRRNNFAWPVEAIEAYLSGAARSLDEAFGLTPRATLGRRRTPAGKALARKVFKARFDTPPAPWTGKSPRALDARFGIDERSLRELYARYRPEFLREELERRLRSSGNEPTEPEAKSGRN